MDDCLFCKIIKGEIPCYKIYEDEYTLAFLDISKDIDGHTLIVPKKHYTSILDCDEDTLNHVTKTVKLISNHYVEKCNFTGTNIVNSNGTSAEQVIQHFHIHIIPRFDNDKLHVFPKLPGANDSLEETLEKLKIN